MVRVATMATTSVVAVVLVVIALSACPSAGEEEEREMTTRYVELRVLVDDYAVKRWKQRSGETDIEKLRKEIIATFVDVQDIYKSFKKHAVEILFIIRSLEIYPNKWVLPQKAITDLTGMVTLNEFRSWLLKNPNPSKYDQDITILLTGEDIARKVKGFGRIRSVCSKNNISLAVSEFSNTQEDAYVIAHEIGHVLALYHDGDTRDSSASECNSYDLYNAEVMAPFTSVKSKNHFVFSYCSYLQIYLNGIDNKCLKNGKRSEAVSGKRFGEVVTVDSMCKRGFGQDFQVVQQRYWRHNDEVCARVECEAGDNDDDIMSMMAPQGISCLPGKKCVLGRCVATPDAPISDSCPFGDATSIDFTGSDNKHYTKCSDLPMSQCGKMKYACCKHCNLAKLNQPDEFCRSKLGPKSALDRSTYYGAASYEKYICSTLACITKFDRLSEIKYQSFKAPNGMICGRNKVCDNGKCIKDSAGGVDYVSDHCPFGNQPYVGGGYHTTCEKFARERAECQNMQKARNICCESCP